jgi:hypothetical protein
MDHGKPPMVQNGLAAPNLLQMLHQAQRQKQLHGNIFPRSSVEEKGKYIGN